MNGLTTPAELPILVSKKEREPLYEPPTQISLYLWLKAMVHRGDGGRSVFSGKFGFYKFQM